MSATSTVTIPKDLLPADGRFGAGPSRVRDAQLHALAGTGHQLLGTSHRQRPVKALVGRVREGLTQLFDLPEGHEIVLGVGGATAFWDVAALGLIRDRSQHVVHGEFSSKFATEADRAPHLGAPSIVRADPGARAIPRFEADIDAYAWPQNETSTGVMSPVGRPDGVGSDQLTLVDATSAAGGILVDVGEVDAYYFAPQKCFASDGGLWIAALSPAAVARAEELAAADRWIPEFLSLTTAIANSRKDQTLNTPAIATLVLLAEQIDWLLEQGGLPFADARTRSTSGLLHAWAERREETSLFVGEADARSQVVTTIDLDESVDGPVLTRILRENGVVDIDPYRKLGRNQLRVATFPAVPEEDVRALIACLDFVMDELR
ncbi:MAG: phosphoserine transaminase [Brachybacterium sp.]|nr:phosphoserine transaminase [Brachybacterium sp.]